MGARVAKFRAHLERANVGANPELMRLALKLATGAGKTTVMVMLIAWQKSILKQHKEACIANIMYSYRQPTEI